ncbi:hypothetical protein CANCADRAFT_4435 [Tortispora caseinolytica NRRL Y-17796]|uniref:Ureidoglycolate lyase n=1 Tax=Tortispora caseinolytica NRRL Y-17796 TaxID=767744 RepID=A0A1E4TDJ7_9ASCO|nr:hypothetical protein CANCADRAFT_4435 [Tortispora caseinolytica NRRL Y-17796]
MPLAILTGSGKKVVATPLTPESFKPFGGVISPADQLKSLQASSANYGTAAKLEDVSPIENRYSLSKSPQPARARWNLFSSKPPQSLGPDSYQAKVLERHPYSTQTFLPLGQSSSEAYIVIVALTRPDGLPDPDSVRAFIARGDQAVTYGVATWHSPMVVLKPTNFAVLIHENGVPNDDCQETYFNPPIDISFSVAGTAKL